MQSLQDIQQSFADGLNAKSDSILACIQPSEKLAECEHFNIYKSSTAGALQRALINTFPVCQKLVGDDFFIVMMNDYISKTISTSPDLGKYGSTFADFIQDYLPAKSLAYLPDVARLEWAWNAIYTSASAAPLDLQKLAECYETQAENIVFSLPPESSLISSPYPIHRIWEVNQNDYQGDETIQLRENEMYYLFIWRRELEMRVDLLDRAEWLTLSWMQANYNLHELCCKMDEEQLGLSLVDQLPLLIQRGWLTSFAVK